MLAQTTQEIEEDIRLYLDETENLSELLNFNLGPGSTWKVSFAAIAEAKASLWHARHQHSRKVRS